MKNLYFGDGSICQHMDRILGAPSRDYPYKIEQKKEILALILHFSDVAALFSVATCGAGAAR